MGAERDEFIKISVKILEHPKIEQISDKSFRVLIALWTYCYRNRTDGFVDAAAWRRRTTRKVTEELLKHGLAEQVGDDFKMHDYLKHQPSREHVERVSAKRAAAGAVGGRVKQSAKQNAKQVATDDGASSATAATTSKIRRQNLDETSSSDLAPQEALFSESAQVSASGQDLGSKQSASVLPTREEEELKETDPPTSGLPRPASRRRPDLPRYPEPGMTVAQRAQAMTRRYQDIEPMSKFPAIMGIVKSAIQSGHFADADIGDALERLAKEGRSVTVDTLRVELRGQPPARGRGGVASPARSTADERIGALDLYYEGGPEQPQLGD